MSAPPAEGAGEEAIDAPPVDRRQRLELLEDCRELVLSRLGRVVGEALAGISDELTELALRETRRDVQQALLDAVSLVRRHKPEIELRFHDAFSEIFERRMRGEADVPQAPQTPGGELTLVDDSEMGERLALDRLVQRARSKLDPDEVLGVRARLGALVERDWFDEKGHPASPEAVFEALRRTLDQLKVKNDVRDALLRALEPHVSANLNDIYSSVNERLRTGRILPSIRARIVSAPDPATGAHAVAGTGGHASTQVSGGDGAGGAAAHGATVGPAGFGAHGGPGWQGGVGAGEGPVFDRTFGDAAGAGAAGAGVVGAGATGPWIGGAGGAGGTGGAGAGGAGSAGGPGPSGSGGVGAGAGPGGPGGGGYAGAGAPGRSGGRLADGPIDADRFTDLLRQYAQDMPGARRMAACVLTDAASYEAAGLHDQQVSPDLMDALSAVQAGFGEAGNSGINLQAAMVEQTGSKGTALDQLTAEIVSIVFDHLYADRRLPDPVKQQLLRLQVVALKAALIDRSFFARSAHPMRRLIDMISEAAVDPEADVAPDSSFVSGVAEIVDWVISSFDRDLSVFDDAAVRFDMLVSVETRARADRQAEVARQAERLDAISLAQQEARTALADRIEPATPGFVREFLDRWWSMATAGALVDQGRDGEAQALRSAESLVWSVAPKAADDIARLASLLPKMIGELSRGIASIDMDEAARQAFFDDLLKWHTRAIQHAKSGVPMPAPEVARDTIANWAPPTIVDDISDEALAAIESLRLGVIIEFVEPDGRRVRLRLAWLSPSRRLFMLTRFPDIARPVRRTELGRLIDSGRARTVGGATALDRAIAAIAAVADRRIV